MGGTRDMETSKGLRFKVPGDLQSSWLVFFLSHMTQESGTSGIPSSTSTATFFFLVSPAQHIPLLSLVISFLQTHFSECQHNFIIPSTGNTLFSFYFEPSHFSQWGKMAVPRPLLLEHSKESMPASQPQVNQPRVMQLHHRVHDVSFCFEDLPLLPSDVATLATRKAKSDAYSTARK